MKHMTLAEAEELIVERMYGTGEKINDTRYEGGVFDVDMVEARQEVDAFIATLDREIDPMSVEITPDRMDEMDIPCVAITIKTGGAA